MSTPNHKTDDQLREIARAASGRGIYSGGVKALRGVWNESARSHSLDPTRKDLLAVVEEAISDHEPMLDQTACYIGVCECNAKIDEDDLPAHRAQAILDALAAAMHPQTKEN